MRIADYFEISAGRAPQREAFVDGERRFDYATSLKFVHAVANALARDPDIPAGAHIGVFSPNNAFVSLLQLGINRSDRAWVLVHTRNSAETNAAVLKHADTKLVFFHSAFAPAVSVMRATLPAETKFVCIDRESEFGPFLDNWLEDCWRPFPATQEDAMANAFLVPTGGTTGPTKIVVHTFRSAEMGMLAVTGALSINAESKHLVIAPLTHAAGFFALSFVMNGGTNVILPGFDIEQVLATIERERITHVYFPPTAVYALLAHPATRRTDLSSLKCILVGGAPTAPAKFKEAVGVFGPIIYEGYGQTETQAPITLKRPADCIGPDGDFDEAALRSAGKPWFFARIEIMDANGRILPPHEPGEIVVLSSMVMKGYYKMPVETEEVSRFGWHHTSDVGVRDERGFITIIDRLNDLIISGGLNIYPSEIEAAICEVEGVLECSVVGVPDEKWGESPKAVVVLKQGAALSEEAIVEHCKKRLGSFKVPRSVEFWADLPRSPVGKVLKREIRKKYWEGQWRAV